MSEAGGHPVTPDPSGSELFGILGRFEDPRELIRAAKAVRRSGYRRIEAYSPYPVHGLARAVGFRRSQLPLLVLLGGVVGCVGGFAMQYWITVIDYPLNVGGRPLNSWPAFMPVTFETTVLAASLTAVLGMLALNGLPRPHHPLFAIPQFDAVARDGFFLFVLHRDPAFEPAKVRTLLAEVGAKEVIDVPNIR